MNSDHLVKMANQIGDFFEAMPDRDQAVRDVADHLRRSWEPRMRNQLLDHLGKMGDTKLDPLVVDAVRVLEQRDVVGCGDKP